MSLAAALPAVAAAFAVTLVRIQVRRRLAPVRSAATRAWQPRDLVLALAVVGTALATRLILLEARPIDNDEPVGLGIASLGAWAAETDSRLHPPLPALLMTWLGGATKIEAARSVSVLAGTASAAIAFAMVRGSAGRGPAFLAGLWLALMPAAIHTSQLARGYALCAFGLIAAHACLEKALATGTAYDWVENKKAPAPTPAQSASSNDDDSDDDHSDDHDSDDDSDDNSGSGHSDDHDSDDDDD